jgi:hypothetical protein
MVMRLGLQSSPVAVDTATATDAGGAVVRANKAPDGTKLYSAAFGGYHKAVPCRTYGREADEWVEEEVLYASDRTSSRICLDRMEAARLRVPDDVFLARGNTAARIWSEELLACHNRVQDGSGA